MEMARSRRLWSPEHYDHVVIRGNNRQNIFGKAEDVFYWFQILDDIYLEHSFTIASYCVMTNHVHLLIRSPEEHLSTIMMKLNKRYSIYFKRKYGYSGHLYEKRYFAKMAKGTRALLDISAYIHRNPIRTNPPIVSSMEDYPYSSYYLIKEGIKPAFEFINYTPLIDAVLGQTVEEYCCYCEKGFERMGSK